MNSILEIIHQVIANLVRTYGLQNNDLDKDDPWSGILAATDFAVQSTYHTRLQATPGHLVFGLPGPMKPLGVGASRALECHLVLVSGMRGRDKPVWVVLKHFASKPYVKLLAFV